MMKMKSGEDEMEENRPILDFVLSDSFWNIFYKYILILINFFMITWSTTK